MIGSIRGQEWATLFGDYLYVKGIENKVEFENHDSWAVWVHREEDLPESQALLDRFLANPSDPRVAAAAIEAAKLREASAREEMKYRKKIKEHAQVFQSLGPLNTGRLTLGLIGICAFIFLLMLSKKEEVFRLLSISNFRPGGGSIGLPEVLRGQVWRLFTPALMHGGVVHIVFNMWWLRDLGSIIEWRQNWKWLLAIVLSTGIGSNLAQYYVSGPNFLGMSGVVYGLLGYLWFRGKFDPHFGVQIPQAIVFLMLLWLFLGFSGFLNQAVGHVANWAHAAGLGLGMVWGFLTSLRARTR